MTERRTWLALLPAAPLLALLLWWAQHDGGYAPRDWLPGGLALAGLLAVIVLGLGPVARVPSRPALVAIAAFAAYVAWSFLSITWADDPGRALQGSERSLVYLIAFVVATVLPWTARTALWALGAWVAGITVLGLVALTDAVTGDPTTSFAGARFSEPLSYYNADAALWTMAALPAVALASRRQTPAPARPALLAATTFLLGLAFITQSRGWAIGLSLTALAGLVLLPGRLRFLVALAAAAIALAPFAPTLLDPYNVTAGLPVEAAPAALSGAMDDAGRALGLAVLISIGVGFVLTALDVRRLPTARTRAAARAGGRALAIVAAVAAVAAVVVVTDGDPIGAVDDAWVEFKGGENTAPGTAGRFSSFGSTRYDLYRVSVDVWRDSPITGVGQDNFLNAYLLLRGNEVEEARWTHSLPLRLLVHTGLVGLLLMGVALVAALVGALRGCGARRFAAATALLPVVLWGTTGLVDWLWEYPVLTVAAFVLLGITLALGADRDPPPVRRPWLGRGAALALAAVSAVLLIPAWIADRDVARASANWTADRQAAYDRLDRASSLAPLDVMPPTVEGVIAARSRDLPRAERAFREAAARDPQNWFPRFQLALLAGTRGDRAAAAASLREARARNPREPLIADAVRRLQENRPVTFAEVDEQLRRSR